MDADPAKPCVSPSKGWPVVDLRGLRGVFEGDLMREVRAAHVALRHRVTFWLPPINRSFW